jgi:hypothetical protein
MRLSTRHTLTAGLVAAFVLPTAAQQPASRDTCVSGYVWREAYPGDRVCVPPDTRTQAAQDNSQANDRRDPGGAYGPNTCRAGYVWREARADDLVCVTPDVREQTKRDNAEAPARRVGAGRGSTITPRPPGGGSMITPRPPVPPILVQQAAYRMSDWSPWSRGDGVHYRHRSGWNTQEPRYHTNVDAIFELRNVSGGQWMGAARSLDCSTGGLSMSSRVTLMPDETREVKFLTTNCGTKQAPYFRPNVVKSVRID